MLRDSDPSRTLDVLLKTPTIASKRWVYEQYDSIVGSRSVRRAGAADAAVLTLRPEGSTNSIATSIDGNGRRVAADPYTGTVEVVLECARNLACVGAEPLGLTNCLNFGNPEKPHIAWQLSESVRGLGDACRALGIPVVGGNVSLYNEGPDGPIYPTPIVGMVGSLPDPARVPGLGFARAGDAVALAGPFRPSLAGSELEKLRGGQSDRLPAIDLDSQVRAIAAVRARAPRLTSVHDVSDGGLAVALAECCIAGGIGARVELPDADEALLFGEGPGGFVVSGSADAIDELAGAVPVVVLGEVGGDRISVTAGAARLAVKVSDAFVAFESGIPDHFR